MVCCVLHRLLMLLMIELFIGDYKGLVNYSAQEFHWIWQKWAKVRLADAELGPRDLPAEVILPAEAPQAWRGCSGWGPQTQMASGSFFA